MPLVAEVDPPLECVGSPQVRHVVGQLVACEESCVADIVLQRVLHAEGRVLAKRMREEIEGGVALRIRIRVGKIETEAIQSNRELV